MAISLNEALAITEDRYRPFDIKFVAFDANRRKGGQLIELIGCERRGASHNMKVNDTISVARKGIDSHPYTIHNHLILEVNKQEVFI
jgi:hypothetical protein